MKIYAETPRLLLRELLLSDIDGMYELDSDPDVPLSGQYSRYKQGAAYWCDRFDPKAIYRKRDWPVGSN